MTYKMNNLLSKEGELYLKDKMNICLVDFKKKLLSDASTQLIFFKDLIDFMISLEPPYKYSEIGDCSDINNIKNDEFLNFEMITFLKKSSILDDSNEYYIFDILRHAFISFKEGGLYSLYKHREAEVWYLKIIIRQNMGCRADINNLNNEVIIYRGTSEDEYTSKKYGQSWTLSKKIADDFAFVHYSGQTDYENTTRVTIKTKIKKESIYYYNKDDDEKEIIVDERKIIVNSSEVVEKKKLL